MTLKTSLLAAIATTALAATVAYAATDGSLGGTSTGTIDISAAKLAGVRISELDDILFGSSTTAPAAQNDQVCIYSTTGSYLITASSGNALGAAFRLHEAGSNYITYTVSWYDAASGGSIRTLTSGVQSAAISNGDTASQTCGGGDNARVEVTVNAASFANAPAGTYTDTLTLVVAPQ